MPRKKKTEGDHRSDSRVMAQQDQSEILDEVGARLDEETGELLVDTDRVREIGAVDVDAVRENRRMKEFVDKKRGGEKVTFNTDDALQRYEMLIATWPPNTIDISVRRLTGSAVQHVITSRPRSGSELYEAIMQQVHREHAEAAYELKFVDSNQKSWRGTGRITMPDTRPAGGAPVNQFYQHPQHPPQAPPVVAPVLPPVVVQPQDMSGMMNTVQGMFDLFQRMQPKPVVTPAAPPPLPPVIQMPPQPAANDPAGQLVWIQQMFEMFQKMQPPGAPPSPPPAPVVVQQPPPPPSPQDSMASTMTVMQQMFEMFQKMQPPPPQQPPAQAPRRPYYPQGEEFRYERGEGNRYERRGEGDRYERRGYDPRDHRDPRDPRGYQPPPPPRTPADELRDAMAVMRTTMQSLREFEAMLPQQHQSHVAPTSSGEDDDDSPIQMVEAGPAKLVFDRTTGDLRTIESLGANVPTVFKWVGEQMQAISKAQAQQQRQQLPPGFVEVTPGYKPPAGYVTVPVDQQNEPLPPPPERMPPPVRDQAPQAPQAPQPAWGAPPPQPWSAQPEPEESAPWGEPPEEQDGD